MDSAATPPAKRAAPRAVAKAKRLILPPGPDGDDESVVIDPVLRAKRPAKSKGRSIDPLLPAPDAPTAEPPAESSVAVDTLPAELDATQVEPVDTVPRETAPVETVPVEAVDTAPADTAVETAPGDRARPSGGNGLASSPDAPAGQSLVDGDPPLAAAAVVAWQSPRARVAPPPTLPPVTEPSTQPLPVDEPLADAGEQTQLFDDVEFTAERPMRKLRQPVALTRRRPRVRRVTRVVRHVDTWSVFKIALVFNIFFYIVCLTSSVLLWQVAQSTGTVDNIERFFEGFGWETFTLNGGELYHNLWVAGLFILVGCTGLAVLLATMFNLITDLVGGMRVTVLEEEVISRVKMTTLTAIDDADPPSPG